MTTTTVRDSVRGKLVLVGSLENPTVWLSTAEGEGFQVLGIPRNILRELTGGLEVVLFGARASGTIPGGRIFNATDYAVRALAGEPAYDGILRVDAARTVLELRDGRRLVIGRLPDALANANGKYVWISGSLASPTQGGIIDPNRAYRTPHSPRMR